ncbi:MAG: ABC transporter permease [Lachnospiraceae bacterium]
MSNRKRYDIWTVITAAIFLLYVLFMLYPLFSLFVSSVIDPQSGGFSFHYFQKFFSKKYYLNTVVNSFKVTACVTILAVAIATPLAYVMTTVKIRGSEWIRVLILISSMSAPFIGAYSWILLLGRNGSITNMMKQVFGIQTFDIYGFTGIVIVLTLQLVPLIFTYVSGALKNMDNSLIEAAESMNCTGIQKMFRVIMPLILPTILAGAILVFMRAIADFGTPMLIGEGFKTIPVLVYAEFMGENGGENGFAAAISILVILLTTGAFLIQKFISAKMSYSTSALNPIQAKKETGIKNVLAHAFVYLYLLIALLPQMCVIETSFRRTSGMVFKPGYSLDSYRSAFSKMESAIKNTMVLGVIALVVIIFISILIAYVTVRRPNMLSGMLDVATMMPYIVPGSILGISLIAAFNKKPLILTGTAFIMVVAFAIKRMPYTVRSSSAILRQIGPSVEEASLSLGASSMKTFYKITLPMMMAGVISGAIMSWITIITELSSSIMLYTGHTRTMTISIYSEVIRGNYGIAAALSTILTMITIGSIFVLFKVTGSKEISM